MNSRLDPKFVDAQRKSPPRITTDTVQIKYKYNDKLYIEYEDRPLKIIIVFNFLSPMNTSLAARIAVESISQLRLVQGRR